MRYPSICELVSFTLLAAVVNLAVGIALAWLIVVTDRIIWPYVVIIVFTIVIWISSFINAARNGAVTLFITLIIYCGYTFVPMAFAGAEILDYDTNVWLLWMGVFAMIAQITVLMISAHIYKQVNTNPPSNKELSRRVRRSQMLLYTMGLALGLAVCTGGLYGTSMRAENFSKNFAYGVSVTDFPALQSKLGWTFTNGVVNYDYVNGTMIDYLTYQTVNGQQQRQRSVSVQEFQYYCVAPVTATPLNMSAPNQSVIFWVVLHQQFQTIAPGTPREVCLNMQPNLWNQPAQGLLPLSTDDSFNDTVVMSLLDQQEALIGIPTQVPGQAWIWTASVPHPGLTPAQMFKKMMIITNCIIVVLVPLSVWMATRGFVFQTEQDCWHLHGGNRAPYYRYIKIQNPNGCGGNKSSDIEPPAIPEAELLRGNGRRGKKAPAAAPPPTYTMEGRPPNAAAEAASNAKEIPTIGDAPPDYTDPLLGISANTIAPPAIYNLMVLLPDGSKRLYSEPIITLAVFKHELALRGDLLSEITVLEVYSDAFKEWLEVGHLREIPLVGQVRLRVVPNKA